MNRLRDAAREILLMALRLFPWPTEPGLRAIGNPDRSSPVLVTGNYDLTVRRVVRALRGVDAWLVVAPSSGINVWCAAAGGHLTTHQVVTAFKTSGIAERVDHRRAVAPGLGATGIVARDVSRRCGWKLRFGPVYAADLPGYLAGRGVKTPEMRHVRFGASERLEMALAWAAPMALVVVVVALLARPSYALPLALLTAAMATTVFLFYDRVRGPRRVIVAGCGAVASSIAVALAGGDPVALATAAIAPVALTLLLTFDYEGSTPVEGGAHFEERRWHITLDPERCRGVYTCWDVCPKACFDKPAVDPGGGLRKITLARESDCMRCAACIVQCPTDALRLEDESGERIEAETIRRYKLNLLGQRRVDTG